VFEAERRQIQAVDRGSLAATDERLSLWTLTEQAAPQRSNAPMSRTAPNVPRTVPVTFDRPAARGR